jgi:hypothetical protein
MHRSRRLVPVRVRATWYAYLALAVAGMLTDATTWAVVVVAVGCAAIPLALVAAHGRAGLYDLLPGIRTRQRSGAYTDQQGKEHDVDDRRQAGADPRGHGHGHDRATQHRVGAAEP